MNDDTLLGGGGFETSAKYLTFSIFNTMHVKSLCVTRGEEKV